ncbi:MAG: cell wall-binding repeat-containing protein [Peptostreptococcus sp.]|uniref:cell wall-binding repeat-containing protein n=1 Tax=Peptostreptococcus sp. TaxID=1262 RepID=UPI002FCAAEB6
MFKKNIVKLIFIMVIMLSFLLGSILPSMAISGNREVNFDNRGLYDSSAFKTIKNFNQTGKDPPMILSSTKTVNTEKMNKDQALKERSNLKLDDNTKNEDTGLYDVTLLNDDENYNYYAGQDITIYNDMRISGNVTVIDEGSYIVVEIAKDKFKKPVEADISTAPEIVKEVRIEEGEDTWKLITVYNKLTGGYSGATPLNMNLLDGNVINGEKYEVKQIFYDKNGTKLSSDSMIIAGKSEIEQGNSRDTSLNLSSSVDANNIVKQDTYKKFDILTMKDLDAKIKDPRDRRIYASIPEGLSVKAETGWLLEESTGRYYKDLKKDQITASNTAIELNLGGIDLSEYTTSSKGKSLRVNYSIQAVVDGKVQDDIKANTWYVDIKLYSQVLTSVSTRRYTKFIKNNYDTLTNYNISWSDNIYLPYNSDMLNNQKVRYTHMNMYSTNIGQAGDQREIKKLNIKKSEIVIKDYAKATKIRIMIAGSLSDADKNKMSDQLRETKVYGIKRPSKEKVLLKDGIDTVFYSNYNKSFDDKGWFEIEVGDYSQINFEYPGEGVVLEGKEEINRLYKSIYSEVIAELKPEIITTLKNKLNNSEEALIKENTSAFVEGVVEYKNSDEIEKYVFRSSDYCQDNMMLQYEMIEKKNPITIENGSNFFIDEIVKTNISYKHTRQGNNSDATKPENLNIYYLVPDGLEPIENKDVFEKMEVVRGYKAGYNLVIASPKTVETPKILANETTRDVENKFPLDFKTTSRLLQGSYTIYSSLSFDNNKVDNKDGKQYGILQKDSPKNLWENILNDGKNRPEVKNRFTDFESVKFKISPPKMLSSFKEVKMSSEADSYFSSSTGARSTIGDKIDYRFLFVNSSTQDVTQLSVIDILPYEGDKSIVPNQSGHYTDRGSKFKTHLIGVEGQEKFEIYYSTDIPKATIEENNQLNWKKDVDDLSKVTMIKAVLKDGQKIKVNEKASIVTHNEVENDDTILDGEKAFNSFAISTNNEKMYLEALKVDVLVNYQKKDVILNKVDKNDKNKKLENAEFSIYKDKDEKAILENIVTDRNGLATIPNLLIGKTYYIKETKAPEGYKKNESFIRLDVKNDLNDITIENIHETDVPELGNISISVNKNWIGEKKDSAKIKLLADGVEKETVVLDESNKWEHTFKDLAEYEDTEEKKKIDYTVSEEKIKGYKSDIKGNEKEGFIITNTKESSGGSGGSGGGSTDTGKNYVIIANGEKYTDVLTASVLANEKKCPILLSYTDTLSENTINEIKRLKTDEVIISGGPLSVSKKVVKQLETKNYDVRRISGENRYETAREIGKEVRLTSKNKNTAILVDGTDFPDAISVSDLASEKRVPILLTEPKSLKDVTQKAIDDWKIKKVIIGGSENSVSKKIEDELKKDLSSVNRIGGKDRYETAYLVAEELRNKTNNTKDAILVDGTNFPDGITISILAAKYRVPILLTHPNKLHPMANNIIKTWKIENILIGGGYESVSKSIEDSMNVKNKDRVFGSDRYNTAVEISKRYTESKSLLKTK